LERKGPSVLRCKGFCFFISGQLVTNTGVCMQTVALQWVVYQQTGSAFLMALAYAFQYIPMLLFSPFAGVFTDRFDKRKVLLITQSLQMLQSLLLGVLALAGDIVIWQLLLLQAFLGTVMALDMPLRHAFHVEMVGKDNIIQAVGMNFSVYFLGKIAGSALAGVILTTLPAGMCFLLSGAGFLATLFPLSVIRSYASLIRPRRERVLHEVSEGLRYIFSKRSLFEAVVCMVILSVFTMNLDVIAPVFSEQVFGRGAGGYSVMSTAVGIGSSAASLAYLFAGRALTRRSVLFVSSGALYVFFVCTGFWADFSAALVSLAFIGFFQVLSMIVCNSLVQVHSSDVFRGRTLSVYMLVQNGVPPAGNLLTGLVVQGFGARSVFLLCGAVAVVFLLPVLFAKRRDGGLPPDALAHTDTGAPGT